jgi:hypothetical protein
MVDVPGVALSGVARITGDATGGLAIAAKLRIGGLLRGELTLRGLTLSGRIGGAAVHAHLVAL